MNPKLKKLIDETEELKRQITNLKSKIRRRGEKLVKTFDSLEKQRIEAEIELLKKKVTALTIEELKGNLSIIVTLTSFGEKKPSIDRIDWSKAGKA